MKANLDELLSRRGYTVGLAEGKRSNYLISNYDIYNQKQEKQKTTKTKQN
jgi:hypothetical protein